jgi:tripartite ATP-independent transporter DctM subunit
MSGLESCLVGFAALFALILLRMPIALALALTGLGGVWALSGRETALYVLASAPIESLSNYTLSVLPLFILMGAFAVHGGLSESLYRFAYSLVGHWRGGLAMAGIGSCAGFGAICGSSIAAATTMTRLLAPEMLRYGYSPKLTAGTIAAGGTLSILIPPSLLMIVYAYLTETSIGQLFAAGIVPGLFATALYMATIWIWTGIKPGIGPAGRRASWQERLAAVRDVWSVLALVALVLGGIFAGLFTPTEGAAVGAAGALALGVILRKIDWRGFCKCVAETVSLSAMLLFIVVGVSFFNFFIETTRMPSLMVEIIEAQNWPPLAVMCIILLFLIALGCFMDSIAIVFITTPVLFPLVQSLGFDPVWYGIMTVMVVEFGLVTPPFGLNVFVVAKMIPEVTTWGAFQGVLPFIASDVVRLAVLLAFPGLVLWLPRLIFGAGP